MTSTCNLSLEGPNIPVPIGIVHKITHLQITPSSESGLGKALKSQSFLDANYIML